MLKTVIALLSLAIVVIYLGMEEEALHQGQTYSQHY
jgi:hypothetical protein